MSLNFNSPPENIIVRMPNWIGDLVMATAALQDLRHRFPTARITAMCQSNLASLLKNDPHLNEVYSFSRPSGWIHHLSRYEIIQELKRGNYDLGLLFTNSFSSAWWFFLGGVKKRIGFAGSLRSLLLTKAIPYPKSKNKQHQVVTYKELLRPLGIPLSDSQPSLFLDEKENREAREALTLMGLPEEAIIVGINPGAAYGSAKCWLPERFVEVSQKLLTDQNIYLLYFGDSAGASLVASICEKLPKEKVINLAGKTSLRELLAFINSCSLLLTNDSGPMHMAAALRVPLVALFGSTDEIRTGPYGSGTVIHKHVDCSPCFKRVCPIDFRCMKQITAEEVYQAVIKLIEEQVKQ